MLKKFIYWSPLFVLASLSFDAYVHWDDVSYRGLAITAMIGWLMYWEALNDLQKLEKDSDKDAKS
jgi:hypothetical protein